MGNDQDQAGEPPGRLGGTFGPEAPANREGPPAKMSRPMGATPEAKLGATTVDRAQKEGVVEELGRIFADSGVVVVAHYEGLSVAEMTDFRLRLKQAGGGVRVAKNKLAKIALKGTPGEKMGDLLTGMTVLAYSEDPVAAAKAVEDFTKVNKKIVVLGGAMGGTPLDQAGVTAVAAMPSREELIASIVATIGAPAAGLAGAIGAPAANIAAILTTLEEREAA